MTKKSLFSTKTIVATGLGAALFMVLFMFVKIPSPVPETNLQIAYGVSAFFGAVFGPICGFLVAFIGHALNDFISYGAPWWSWVIASGVAALIGGAAYFMMDAESGKIGKTEILKFCIVNIIANFVAWVIVAPVLDIVIYSEPVNLVFAQGVVAFILDAICACVIGSLLLVAYAKTKTSKGSLTKD
ncbi:ECF-type riboflavin transporter substrate-binding protein [Anaerorhabdus sp.]|jgi:energy-coupling factor transport system substrate-specific component|nr:ECF-type riboflavin transporter substrate-binding protein [Anaerorhabdus sp.]MEA4875698.1 ECF-type riboflavin transporter substrate-binding protein [Anaerorhabdus sp.]